MITIRSGLSTQSGGGGISARLLPVNLPNKTEYVEGEQLDLSGLSLKFEEIGGEPSTVSEYKTIPENGSVLKRGISSIQINYKKDNVLYSAFIPIIVKYAVGIEVASFPKHSYKTKDALNTSGLKINLIYNDGSIKEISSGFTTLPENGSIIGETTEIKITYGDMVTYYKINIDNVSSAISKSGLVSNYLATFKNATDVQIEELLNFHYAGEIDIADYWKVGDKREYIVKNYRTSEFSTNSSTIDNKKIIFTIVDFNKILSKIKYAIILTCTLGSNYDIKTLSGFKLDSSSGNLSDNNISIVFLHKVYEKASGEYSHTNQFFKSIKWLKKAPYAASIKIPYNIVFADSIYKVNISPPINIFEDNTNEDIISMPIFLKYINGEKDSFDYFKSKMNRSTIEYIADIYIAPETSINVMNNGGYYISKNEIGGFSYYLIRSGEISTSHNMNFSYLFKELNNKDHFGNSYYARSLYSTGTYQTIPRIQAFYFA